MKRFLLTILFLLFICIQNVFAEDVFKITGATFDTSNSFAVLNIQDETEQPVTNEIKLVQLDNPKRAYFDIPSAILAIPKQDWSFNTDGVKSIKISQFSTEPNVVRVVIYFDENFNPSSLKFVRLKNNIFIKLKDFSITDTYFNRTFRDERTSANDFYEYLTIEVPDTTLNTVNQIQQAFNQQTTNMPIKKELKLNTKYYINQITPKNNSVLINGFGSASVEKPLILQNPTRLVYDIPNAFVNPQIRNNEYKISETESVKIGQFTVNKARIVITTPNVSKYIPIYSSDNQSLIFANTDNLKHTSLFNQSGDIISYNIEKIDNRTNAMILSFNHPLVYAIDRLNSNLVIYLYNISRYNEDTFRDIFKNTIFANSNISLLSGIGLKLTVPVEQDTISDIYTGADGRTLKIQTKHAIKSKPPVTVKNTAKKIVIDPGHGGNDCGAIRNNITEKSITLDVSKRVKDILTKQGYIVEMTRTGDETVSLQERVEFSEEKNPDIFVSIHVNSSEKPEITGIETHYWRDESLTLAKTIHASMANNLNSKNRGLFKSKFYVINHTTAPAILVEIGFISNAGERAELISEKRKQETAKAIAEGVQNYFKDNK